MEEENVKVDNYPNVDSPLLTTANNKRKQDKTI